MVVTLLTAVTAGGFAALPPDRATTIDRYRDGPPPGFTGGFGEESCHACHFSSEPNDAAGTLTVEGVPENYRPGEVYALRVTLRREGMMLGGFQLATRFEDGSQAGLLRTESAEEARVGISEDRGVQYALQRAAGAEPAAPGVSRWTVRWVAPESSGRVRIHVAANAADGDDSTSGDFVYTASFDVGSPE